MMQMDLVVMRKEGTDFKSTSHICMVTAAVLFLLLPFLAIAQDAGRITIIYDAFGAPSALQKDWGFAALVEYRGKRILFDTGNNAKIFEHNVRELGINLTHLDAVVLSHRHGDHTSGLTYLLTVNSAVKIYAPQEAGFFKNRLPESFLTPDSSLPMDLRYYDGKNPESFRTGTPWELGDFETVAGTTEVFPGFYMITVRSEKPGTMEMNEVSLVLRTPKGLVVVVGCSHPGVERILEKAAEIDGRLYLIIGGFHLVVAPPAELRRTAAALDETFKVERVAPAHCTSEPGFAVLLERFKNRFDRAGVGAVITLP